MFRRTGTSRKGTAGPGRNAAEALRLVSVSKTYGSSDENAVTALDRVSLGLRAGTFTAVMGPSGSGKSTLLQCAAGLDRPDGGMVVVDGEEMTGGSEAALTKFRRRRIGFVFQQYNLLPTLTVEQNTTLPLKLARRRIDKERAREILTQVGLGDRLNHRPDELSGGQRQRVAIARALVTEPSVIFADEPTGALDTRSARDVLRLLQEAVRTHGRTVVMVTHDPVAASYADSVVFLADGRLAGELHAPTVDAVAERMAHLGDDTAAAPAAAPGTPAAPAAPHSFDTMPLGV
ncbi:ABC transporter ATP-binding protein [Streptomyces sp. E11-3]|uniref:ABC transporter ATP-binding protein n=1 Tax=Streptomyces sp. E11-3 TaxID=3110112 RepID=UPI00398059F2